MEDIISDSKTMSLDSALLAVKYPHTFSSETLLAVYQFIDAFHKENSESIMKRIVTIMA